MRHLNLSLLILFSLLTFGVNARIIDVTKFGVTIGKDATYSLNELITQIKGEKGVTLLFPQGKYEFYPENAIDRYCAVTNHDNSLKKIIFDLQKFENITIDGDGSIFLFYGMVSPFVIDSSKNVTIKDLTIDWDSSFNHELKVVETNAADSSFIVEVLNHKYSLAVKDNYLWLGNYNWEDKLWQNLPYDPQTKTLWFDSNRFVIRNGRAKYKVLENNRVLIKNGTAQLPPIGTIYCNITENPSRLSQAIHSINSKDIGIQNVTIHTAGGMGVIAERSENITIDKVMVTPSANRTFSVRADATHFNGCKGLIKVTNSTFENMGDDAINVHGSYVDIVEYMGDNTFLCQISHQQQWGLHFCSVGDKIMMTSRIDLSSIFETEVTATKYINERRFTVTVDKLPEIIPEQPLSFENITWNADVIMRDCKVQRNRARSVLISTKGKVLVENNYFSSEMHGVLIEGDNRHWYESGAVKDVVIKNNIFDNGGFGGKREVYPLYISPMLTDSQRLSEKPYHRNIEFSNNKIINYSSRLVFARSVENLVVENNIIERSTLYPTDTTSLSVVLDFCKNVSIKNNKWLNFTNPVTMKIENNSQNVKHKNNSGADF